MSLYWIKEMDKLLYSVNFHSSKRTTLFSATGITTSLSMLAFVSLTIKGRATIQHMYIQYGRGGVLPRGQKHKPRLFPSCKWCEITPTVNKYGRDWRKQLFCASHTCNIGTTMKTTVNSGNYCTKWRSAWMSQYPLKGSIMALTLCQQINLRALQKVPHYSGVSWMQNEIPGFLLSLKYGMDTGILGKFNQLYLNQRPIFGRYSAQG